MSYLKIKDDGTLEYPYSLINLRNDNPNTSFPQKMSDALLQEWDVYPVKIYPKPIYDPLVQVAMMSQPFRVNEEWAVTYSVENLPENIASDNVRNKRNELLSECDWTQLPDAPVDKEAWAAYRQQLRDISEQPDFPYQVNWPTKP